jgi:16S rRNA C967 or C1407 C5-methylase (RsmB/RsmF family)/NOL1/NOP2/fmu family ribosome biogenesis protein
MQAQLGAEWGQFEFAHDLPSPVSIRINPSKRITPTNSDGKVDWARNGVYLKERPVFTLDPLFHAGCYYVQEASSMFLEQALTQHVPLDRPLRVLDLCAAPGGKSTHLLSLLNDESLLVSNEVIRSRVNVLSENIQKWGYHNAVVTNNDPADFSSLEGFFDLIVLDAPCSGEGLFRKDPKAMEEWSEENVQICSQRQQRIIADVWPSLKEDGILIYSTCTYNPSEDEDILTWIDDTFDVEFLPVDTSAWPVSEVKNGKILACRLYPHKVRGEGFFISVMKKKESQPSLIIKPSKAAFVHAEKRIAAEVNPWLLRSDETLIRRDDLLQLLPARHSSEIHFLTQRLRVIYAGTFIASVKHNKLVPEHALALSRLMRKENFIQTTLDEKEALQYLKKETIAVRSNEKGFSLATFNDVPLGWMNLLGGRINNMYPQEWRIRMQVK